MRHRWLAFVTFVALCGAAFPSAHAQVRQETTGRLEATTSSAEARTAFWAALDDFNNIFPTRGRIAAQRAVSLDPAFGVARAVMAANAADLSAARRAEELNRAVSDAARATTGELLFAAALRANSLGRQDEARVLANATVALLPNDPNVAYLRAALRPGSEWIDAMREVTQRFPDFAPAHNVLAYQLWAADDRAGAMQAVQRYVRLAPRHPNSHDSYAELLQWAGRHSEALQHYQAAIALDSAYNEAYTGIAEVHLLMGNTRQARAAYAQAADKASTPAARITALGGQAMTYVIDGKPKDAVRGLEGVATMAEQQNLRPQAAAVHRVVGLIEASFGDRRTVAGHLAKAAELGGPDAPAQHRYSALAYAIIGELDKAKVAAAKLNESAAGGSAAARNNAREVNAVIAVAERDLAKARAELSQAGVAAFGRAVLAEATKRGGNRTEAQALRTEILAGGTVTPTDVIGRAKASKI